MNYWLMKGEPDSFSIDDLRQKRVERWDGIRNYQVRNTLRDQFKKGDRALFYHSSAKTKTGVVGEMEVVREAYADPTQFDPQSDYYDQKSNPERPTWLCVDVRFLSKFTHPVTLEEMKHDSRLAGLSVLKKGNRLSVQSVAKKHYAYLERLGN